MSSASGARHFFGNLVTLAKLAPLLLFAVVGMFHVEWAHFQHAPAPVNADFAKAVLLLSFAFVGWESVVVAAGETRDPRRHLPHALIAGLAVVAVLYLSIQWVCIGTLPQLAQSARPLVDAARTFSRAGGCVAHHARRRRYPCSGP